MTHCATWMLSSYTKVFIVLVASSALVGYATEQGVQVREEVVKETREETALATEPPLIVADILRVGDAKVVTTEIAGKAFVTRHSVGREVTIGFELARGDLIELTPESRLLLSIAGHRAELVSSKKSVWYKLE